MVMGPGVYRCLSFMLLFAVAVPANSRSQDASSIDPTVSQDLLNSAVPGGATRDPTTQLMMLDRLDVMLAGSEARGPESGETWVPGEALQRHGGALFLATDADGQAILFRAEEIGESGAAPQEVNVTAFLQSLGTSTGEAFELHILNGAQSPISFSGDGIVVEPLVIKEQAQQLLQDKLTGLASQNPLTAKLNAYCLEFLKQPPTVGQLFQIAQTELQEYYAPARNILAAGRQLFESGLLTGEGDPLAYVHSIKQWALWAHEGDFTFDSFLEAFTEHTKDNFAAAGQPWTDQVQELIQGVAPDRWEHVQLVLDRATDIAPDLFPTG